MDTELRKEKTRAAIERMLYTMRLHHRVVEKRVDGLGVHHSQHRTLMKLSGMGKTMMQKDIAQAMDVSAACVTRSIKILSAAGLIGKTEGEDGRCREITLLPAGQKLVEESFNAFRKIDEEMFEGISDAEIQALTDTLNRLCDNLCRMENEEGVSRV